MLRASIDIGSNSVLLLVLDYDSDSSFKELEDCSHITSLGRELDKTGVFHKESMADTLIALNEYKEILSKHNLRTQDCLVTATEASRVAKNAKEFFNKIKDELGFEIKIISGEGEAYYTAKGASLGAKSEEYVIMDIGGASTEFIKVKHTPFEIKKSISIPIGAVRAQEWLSEGIFEEKTKLPFSEDIKTQYKTDELVCVAGCMTSIGAMFKGLKNFDPSVVNNLELTTEEFEQFIHKYIGRNAQEILEEFPFLGKRAKVMNGGEASASLFVKGLGVKKLIMSTYGLRYGTAVSGEIDERFLK